MPHVKYNTTEAGPKGVRHAGGVHEVTADEAKALIAGRFATPHASPTPNGKPVEKAKVPDNAEKRGG